MTRWEWMGWEGVRFWTSITVGIGVGALGAYGRERHEGRKPDRKWLANRALIMPFLAITASAAADTIGLSMRAASFVAALLSLLAYDAVRVISARALKKADAMTSDLVDAAGEDKIVKISGSAQGATVIEAEVADPQRSNLRKAYRPPVDHDPAIDTLIEKLGDTEI